MEQVFQGIPVWGSDLMSHSKNGAFERVNGRYSPTPTLNTLTPALDETAALTVVKNQIGVDKIKTHWSENDLQLIDGQPFSATLLVFHRNGATNGERLAWHIVAHPNILSRLVYFVDAVNGEILDHYDNTCNFVGHLDLPKGKNTPETDGDSDCETETLIDGPVNVSGQDLLNINRTFNSGGWQAGSVIYLEDVSKSMYNAGSSNMPGDPVGVVVTLDGLNGSPENSNFDYDFVKSNSTTFTNKKAAISAHYNAGASFDYYKSKFNRNAIDGVGGNILSFVNVTESDGSSMENAFWNGDAMFRQVQQVMGIIAGIFPGVGAIIPTFIAYILEKRVSKEPERFGEIGARPPGARTVDVMNFASDLDLFKGWAEAVCHGTFSQPIHRKYNACSIFKRARGHGRLSEYRRGEEGGLLPPTAAGYCECGAGGPGARPFLRPGDFGVGQDVMCELPSAGSGSCGKGQAAIRSCSAGPAAIPKAHSSGPWYRRWPCSPRSGHSPVAGSWHNDRWRYSRSPVHRPFSAGPAI